MRAPSTPAVLGMALLLVAACESSGDPLDTARFNVGRSGPAVTNVSAVDSKTLIVPVFQNFMDAINGRPPTFPSAGFTLPAWFVDMQFLGGPGLYSFGVTISSTAGITLDGAPVRPGGQTFRLRPGTECDPVDSWCISPTRPSTRIRSATTLTWSGSIPAMIPMR